MTKAAASRRSPNSLRTQPRNLFASLPEQRLGELPGVKRLQIFRLLAQAHKLDRKP